MDHCQASSLGSRLAHGTSPQIRNHSSFSLPAATADLQVIPFLIASASHREMLHPSPTPCAPFRQFACTPSFSKKWESGKSSNWESHKHGT